MKLICKIFGHRWLYFRDVMYIPGRKFRVCKHCNKLQDLRDLPVFGKGWYGLIQYTDKGAKENLKEFYEKRSK